MKNKCVTYSNKSQTVITLIKIYLHAKDLYEGNYLFLIKNAKAQA